MTRVVHVISGLDTGGAETMLVRLAGELKERGFTQDVVSIRSRGTKARELQELGVPVMALNLGSAMSLPNALWHLKRFIEEKKPDILQGWMYHGDIFAALAHRFAGGRKSRKVLWNIRASDTGQGGYGGLLRFAVWLSSWPDMVLANSRAGLDFHIAQGYRPRRSDVIANGIDETIFKPTPFFARK